MGRQKPCAPRVSWHGRASLRVTSRWPRSSEPEARRSRRVKRQLKLLIMQHYTVVRIVLYRIRFVYETVLRDHAIRRPWLAAVRFEGITAHACCNTVLNLLRSRRVPLTLYRVCSFPSLGSGFEPAVSSSLFRFETTSSARARQLSCSGQASAYVFRCLIMPLGPCPCQMSPLSPSRLHLPACDTRRGVPPQTGIIREFVGARGGGRGWGSPANGRGTAFSSPVPRGQRSGGGGAAQTAGLQVPPQLSMLKCSAHYMQFDLYIVLSYCVRRRSTYEYFQ